MDYLEEQFDDIWPIFLNKKFNQIINSMKGGLNVRPRLEATYAGRKRQGNQREVARMEREMTTLKSTTKEKTHGKYIVSLRNSDWKR